MSTSFSAKDKRDKRISICSLDIRAEGEVLNARRQIA